MSAGPGSDGAETSEPRRPVTEVLPGLEIHPLEDGVTWSSVFLLVKATDQDGVPTWAYRTSAVPNREELLGALMVQVELLRQELTAEWESS